MQNLIQKNLSKRYKKEFIFKLIGFLSIASSIIFLMIFFSMILTKSYNAFFQHEILLEIDLSKESIIKNSNLSSSYENIELQDLLEQINYANLIEDAWRKKFPDVKSDNIISISSDYFLQKIINKNNNLVGKVSAISIPLSSRADIYYKYKILNNLSPQEVQLLEDLLSKKITKAKFNLNFFQEADSREPESAGIAASLIGSLFTITVFLIFTLPIGIMSAFYLEEFAKKNKFTDIIEISINNLASIPSIIYGLLGLTIYLQFMNMPRSSSLVAGMTLSMLVLPIIIISTRNTIRSIPKTIRDAAIALGSSKMQVILHHIFPLSIPGIMTGTILSISRALGETAPLLMIGMVAFIADIPKNILEPSTVLPVQIYLWSDSAEMGFAEKTSAAILILLVFLITLNLIAIILRKKFERKW